MDASSVTTKTKKSATAYGRGFEQRLIDRSIITHRVAHRHKTWGKKERKNGVYLDNRVQKPDNIEEIKKRLAQQRPSLSPSKFSERAFEDFQASDFKANDEEDLMIDVIPVIHGKQSDHFLASTTKFGNLDPLIAGPPVAANPDLCYGARSEQLNRHIRGQLINHIVPSTMEDKPMAANCYLEVKGPEGSAAVARRQACYDGAIGARGMPSLHSHGKERKIYDNRAYTISSTYSKCTQPTLPHQQGLKSRRSNR